MPRPQGAGSPGATLALTGWAAPLPRGEDCVVGSLALVEQGQLSAGRRQRNNVCPPPAGWPPLAMGAPLCFTPLLPGDLWDQDASGNQILGGASSPRPLAEPCLPEFAPGLEELAGLPSMFAF